MFTINELAVFTGLTTRTIRNYMNLGLIHGTKKNGKWQFEDIEIDRILTDPYIRLSMESKKKSLVEDFMRIDKKQKNEMCVILDSKQTTEERENVIRIVNDRLNDPDCEIDIMFEQIEDQARLILTGPEAKVLDFLMEYRKLKAAE